MSSAGPRGPRGMAQLGSASALGAEGRRFESGYPDSERRRCCSRACRGRSILRPLGDARPELSTGAGSLTPDRGRVAGCPPRLAAARRASSVLPWGPRSPPTTPGWPIAGTCVRRCQPGRRALRGHGRPVDDGRAAHRRHRHGRTPRRGACGGRPCGSPGPGQPSTA